MKQIMKKPGSIIVAVLFLALGIYPVFQSQQFLAVHLIFLCRIKSMYRLNQKRSRLRLKFIRQVRFL